MNFNVVAIAKVVGVWLAFCFVHFSNAPANMFKCEQFMGTAHEKVVDLGVWWGQPKKKKK